MFFSRKIANRLMTQDLNDESTRMLLQKLNKNNLKFETKGLPDGWVKSNLTKISTINPPKPNIGTIKDNLEVSFVPMKCVQELTGKVDLTTTRKYTKVRRGYTYFRNGDIIFAKITPCMENGKVAIMDNLKNGIGFGSTEFHVVRLTDDLSCRKFYFYYLVQDEFRNAAQNHMKGTAGQLRVPVDYLENVLVPIPPLPEQYRIVQKIESIFAQIDAAKERLERLARQTSSGPDSISQLKSSILKQAFEGKLVPQDPNDEPAEALLKRLHDKTLQFKKEGLPEGWTSVIFKHLIKKIPLTGKKIKHQEYQKKGTIPIIDQGQGFIGGYTENVERIVSCNLPVIVFGDHTKSIKFVDHKFAAGADGVKVLEPNPILNPKLLYYFIQSIQLPDRGYARHYQFLEKTIIHMPPLAEQHRIVQKIESIFARIDARIIHFVFA